MSHVLTLTESSGTAVSVKAASLGDIGIIVTSKGATPAETAILDAHFRSTNRS
jgi:predicted HD phosphohydrolase